MSFNISAWSIKQPVPTIVLFLVLTIGGLLSFPLLGIDDSPNIDVPSVSISVSQPGADPAELESQVTKKVEDAVAGLGNIDHIISTVNDGSSNTTVNFLLGIAIALLMMSAMRSPKSAKACPKTLTTRLSSESNLPAVLLCLTRLFRIAKP